MRRHFCILLIIPAILFGCRPKGVKDYAIIIRPIGPSDVTRTTFYIALKKTNFKKDNPFVDEILTDENSLRTLIEFIEDNQPAKNGPKKIAGWYAIEISVYKATHLIMDYKRYNKEESRYYLGLLIKNLASKNFDTKLTKDLTERGLSEIDY